MLPKRTQKQLTEDMARLIAYAFSDGKVLADDSVQYPLDAIYCQALQDIQDGVDPTAVSDKAWVAFYDAYGIGS